MLNKRFIFLKAALTICPLSSLLADTPGPEYDQYPIDTLIVDNIPHKKHKDIQKQPQLTEQQIPWLTGPLLTPSGNVVPSGHYNIEPYLYGATNFGLYNSNWHGQSLPDFYNLLFQVPIQIGLPGPWDFQFVPQWEWNHTHGASSWALGDLNLGFDYQIIAGQPHKWWPSIKLQMRINLPIGKYEKLNPNKKLTQAFGTGSWLPNLGLVFLNYSIFTANTS